MTAAAATPTLARSLPGMPAAAPVRIVHLGVGNFARAHQAWYTAHAPDAPEWGIAAFTGRRPTVAEALALQDGLYTLITRSADGDRFEVVGALSAVHPAGDHAAYLDHLRRPEVAVVTVTVTEAGYLRGPDGHLADSAELAADAAGLRTDAGFPVTTLPGRLVAGLLARRSSGAGPLTLLSCDNLPDNGEVTRTVALELAERVDPSLARWAATEVDFASSMVDRITPATTDADRELVAEHQGYTDAAPVPSEPFSEWVVSGRFPAGRPQWEAAGVTLVDDVGPFEQRKLRLLNASHSLLAYAGSVRGHASIDEAIADPACRAWVEQLWDEAGPHLPLPGAAVRDYRAALLDRYTNPRIRHQLAQIATDGSVKLPVRILPTLRAERSAGRVPPGCAAALAGWTLHLRGQGAPVADVRAAEFGAAAAGADLRSAVTAVLALLDRSLAGDGALLAEVTSAAERMTS